MFKKLLLIFLLAKLTESYEPIHCCKNVNILNLNNNECLSQSTKSVSLACESKFYIEPETDDIEVLSNGDLLYDDMVTSVSNYCVANFSSDNGTTAKIGYLVCIEPYQSNNLTYLAKGSLMIISVAFLLLTLYIYHILPDLRQTLDKVTAWGVLCLMLFMTFLSMIQFEFFVSLETMCRVIAYFMYFFAISYFAWLKVIMFNVWKLTTGRRWAIKERSWYFINHLYVWSVAIILTTIVYFYDRKHESIGVISCWFRTNEEQQLFLYLPVSVTITINLVLFFWVICNLNSSESDISPDRKKSLKYKCKLYLKLFLLSGLIWFFEVLSFHLGHITPIVWIIVDFINCLHGVLVFFVLIVWRQRIKRELAGKMVLCFICPHRWAEIEDDEQETLNEEDATKYDMIIQPSSPE